ncbi:riboflavin biosynthesis protein RibD, partial [Aliarcobacter butzleri]
MKIDDNFYMRLAIDEAWKHQLLTYPNPAVGCVIVKNQRLLAVEAHKEAGMP